MSLNNATDLAIQDSIKFQEDIITMLRQDYEVWLRMKERGLDPTKSFRTFYYRDTDGKLVVQVATTEEEGTKYAQDYFNEISNETEFSVRNKTTKRFYYTDEERKQKIEEWKRRQKLIERLREVGRKALRGGE
jgi:hypothetical protein